MNKPEQQLKKLLDFKIEVQKFEETLERNKKVWKDLGMHVRSDSQKLYEMKKTLFGMI